MDHILDNNEEPVNYLHRGVGNARGWIFCFAVFACPLVYSFQFTSFLHPKEILLLLCLMGMGLCVLVGYRDTERLKIVWSSPWMLIYVLGLPAAVFFDPMVKSYFVECRLSILLLIILTLWASDLIADDRWRERIWNAAILSGIGVALLALGQYFSFLECMFPVFPSYTQPMYSVFGNQDLLGCYMAIIMPMLLHRILEREHKLSKLTVMLFALSLLTCVLILSASRSAWLAAAIGCVLMLWWHRGRLSATKYFLPLLAIATLLAIINAPLILNRTTSTFSEGDVGGRARLWFWDGALRMSMDHPWKGVGLGNYKYWSPYYQGLALHEPGGEKHFHNTLFTDHAHNEYLEYIAETGLIGATILLVFLYFLLRCRGIAWVPLIALAVCAGFNAVLHSVPHAVLGFIFCTSLFVSKPIRFFEKGFQEIQWRRFVVVAFILEVLVFTSVPIFYRIYRSSHAQAQAEHVQVIGVANPISFYEKSLTQRQWPNYQLKESIGIAFLNANEARLAMVIFEFAKEGLDTGRIYYLLGTASADLGEKEKAIGYYKEALFRWPSDQQTFDALLSLLSGEERESMRAHATRFGVRFSEK